jgi:5'-nucleotidase
MRILLSNDDGVRSPGLWAAARELSRWAHVTVVAPDREQSGVGTSVTFHHPLRLKKELSEVDGVKAYSVEGTPGDSVILALSLPLVEQVPDVVVSGINEGANLGDDVFISGTVGAALQGYFSGILSVSASVASPTVGDFSPAAELLSMLVLRLSKAGVNGKMLLNLNVPAVPLENIKALRMTRLADRKYADGIRESSDDRKKKHYWIARGQVEWLDREGTDQWAIKREMASITQLMASPLRRTKLELDKIAADVFEDLRADCGPADRIR